jgi:L-lysine 2,3-aminomutase
MRRRAPNYPLLRQVLPLGDEDSPAPGFTADPVGELALAPQAGVLHKYCGRALVVATGACAVHTNHAQEIDADVLPCYLHMLDLVEGAAHFEVSDKETKNLHRQLTARLPGYLVPRLLREVPGAPAKVGVDL